MCSVFRILPLMAVWLVAAAAYAQSDTPHMLDAPLPELLQRETGWVDLFDGGTLAGWVQRGGNARFEAKDQSIVGTSRPGTPNSYLCTEEPFTDFLLALQFRVDANLNSGVQIRSASRPDYREGQVHGYQIEIDPSLRGWTGGIFDEGRRGWLFTLKQHPDARAAFRLGEWNQMVVEAMGPRLRVWINDQQTAELTDDLTASGFIALQIHAVDDAKSQSVRWREIRLLPLPVPVPTPPEPSPTEPQDLDPAADTATAPS